MTVKVDSSCRNSNKLTTPVERAKGIAEQLPNKCRSKKKKTGKLKGIEKRELR